MFDIGAIVKPYTDSIADLNKFNTELILINKELLEACEEALEWFGEFAQEYEKDPFDNPLYRKLESAIKKATNKGE